MILSNVHFPFKKNFENTLEFNCLDMTFLHITDLFKQALRTSEKFEWAEKGREGHFKGQTDDFV